MNDDDTDCATPVSLGNPMNQDCKNMELAWNFVEWIVDRHKKLAGSPKGSHLIETLAMDDMVFTAKKFIACQAEFQKHGIWPQVSLGFHYTKPANLERIKQDGLMTRAERCGDQTYAIGRLTYGDGIYVGNNPNAFGRFGKVGIIVAIIKGKCERATGRQISIDTNTVIGNKHRSDRSASANGNNYFDEIVLQESCQCLPLIKYDASLLNESIKLGAYFKELQRGVDKFLNNDLITTPFDTDHNMTNPAVSSGGPHDIGQQDLLPWPSNPFTALPTSLTSSSTSTSTNNYTSLSAASLPMPIASLPIPAASLDIGKNIIGWKNLSQPDNISAYTNTLNTTPINNITQNHQNQEKYFLNFTRVLMSNLENSDKEMHARAKSVIGDCADQNKQNNPAHAKCSVSMQRRLRALVGEACWKKTESYLCKLLKRHYQTKDGMSPHNALMKASLVARIAASPLPALIRAGQAATMIAPQMPGGGHTNGQYDMGMPGISSLTKENHQPQQEHVLNRAQQLPQIPQVTLKQQFPASPLPGGGHPNGQYGMGMSGISSLTKENHQPQQEHVINRAQQLPQIPPVMLKQQFPRQPEPQKRKADTLVAIVRNKRPADLADNIPNTVTSIVVDTTRTCHYTAPESFTDSTKENVFSEVAVIEQKSKELCVICLEEMKHGEKIVRFNIDSCNHTFHRGCIESALRRMPRCPICRKYVKEPQGYSPSGTLTITVAESTCSGFEHESTRTFVLNYVMPGNTQKSYHPNPGVRYTSTVRKAYIPDVPDGRKLLQRLLYAFEKGLLFLIGTSGTTGRQNVIIWSSVHQKTQQFGGAMNHGFPDPGYFINCNEELDALGVPTDPHIDTVSL